MPRVPGVSSMAGIVEQFSSLGMGKPLEGDHAKKWSGVDGLQFLDFRSVALSVLGRAEGTPAVCIHPTR